VKIETKENALKPARTIPFNLVNIHLSHAPRIIELVLIVVSLKTIMKQPWAVLFSIWTSLIFSC